MYRYNISLNYIKHTMFRYNISLNIIKHTMFRYKTRLTFVEIEMFRYKTILTLFEMKMFRYKTISHCCRINIVCDVFSHEYYDMNISVGDLASAGIAGRRMWNARKEQDNRLPPFAIACGARLSLITDMVKQCRHRIAKNTSWTPISLLSLFR